VKTFGIVAQPPHRPSIEGVAAPRRSPLIAPGASATAIDQMIPNFERKTGPQGEGDLRLGGEHQGRS